MSEPYRQNQPDQEPPCARYSITVRGRVQGVGYRFFVREQARALGLTGWVRNEVDGCVSMEVQGCVARVDALCASLNRGPIMSHVTECTKIEIPAKEDEGSFLIRQ